MKKSKILSEKIRLKINILRCYLRYLNAQEAYKEDPEVIKAQVALDLAIQKAKEKDELLIRKTLTQLINARKKARLTTESTNKRNN